MSTIKIHYWPVKARAHHIKALLQAANMAFEEVNAGDMSHIKAALPFGQVPFMEDGDVKIAQSNAIFRYLARKAGLQGDNDAEFALSEMLIEEANDLFSMLAKAQYPADGNKNAAYDALFAAGGPYRTHCAFLEKLLPGGDSPFFKAGEKRLAGGIALAASLDIALTVDASLLDGTPKLKAFYDAMMATPAFGNGLRDTSAYFKRD